MTAAMQTYTSIIVIEFRLVMTRHAEEREERVRRQPQEIPAAGLRCTGGKTKPSAANALHDEQRELAST